MSASMSSATYPAFSTGKYELIISTNPDPLENFQDLRITVYAYGKEGGIIYWPKYHQNERQNGSLISSSQVSDTDFDEQKTITDIKNIIRLYAYPEKGDSDDNIKVNSLDAGYAILKYSIK